MLNTTNESVLELMATTKLYPYMFEVCENGHLSGSFGDNSQTTMNLLRFSGSFLEITIMFYSLFSTLRNNLVFLQMNTYHRKKLTVEKIGTPIKIFFKNGKA